MTVRGIGSRSSPIIVDDDDDIGQPSPITVHSGSSLSRSVTPPQESLGMVKAQDPIPANPEGSKKNIGYSILVRMGYKPGLGLGMNLEGVTSPVKACTRFQKFPTGLGANNVLGGSSKLAQPTEENATRPAKPRSIPTTTNETSSSLPRNKTIFHHGSSNHESPPTSLLRSTSGKPPAVSSSIDVTLREGSTPVHDDGKRNVDTTKTPSSTPTTHLSDAFRTPRTATKKLPPSILFSIPSSVPLRFSFPPHDSRVTVPVNPPLNSVDVISPSIHPVPLPKSPPTVGIPYSSKLRGRIGMPPDEKGAGVRGSFPKQLEPPPNPFCSVVMEILPRKFRTQAFVVEWLLQFTFRPSRYELVDGRVFFEFETERDALLAWNSPQMGGKEGLHGVRLFWYIVTAPATSARLGNTKEVNATRTIMNSTQPQSVSSPPRDLASNDYPESQVVLPAPQSPQYKLVPLPQPQQSSPPAPSVEVQVQDPDSATSPTKDKTSTSNTKMSFSTSFHLFGNSSVPSPSPTTGPWVSPTTPSDLSSGRLVTHNATRDEATGFAPCASVSPTPVPFPMSPTSSSTLDSSSSSVSPSLVPSLTTNTPESWRTSTVLDDKALSTPSHPELIRELQLPMELCYPDAGVEQAALTPVDGTRPFANGSTESADSVALAKELALRQMVLRSRKRKVVAPANGQQPTSDRSAAAARSALEELAVNFISDAISRPPPAKRIKITPSASALAAWGKRLEAHIEKSRVIMAEIQGAQFKAEKDKLFSVLREHNRMIDEEKTALFSIPAAEIVSPISPWPETHPDGGVLVLSDTDDGDEDDDADMD